MAVVSRYLSRYLFATVVVSLLGAVRLGAQDTTGTITGRVVDSASQTGVPSVRLNVVGTTLNALTRDDGSYTLTLVPAGPQRVRASRIGFVAQEGVVNVTAGQSASLDFTMSPSAVTLSDVVVTGYGTQRRAAITGAVSQVDASEANVGVQPNVNNMIQGRPAGVNVTVNSGDPGAGSQIRIRGGTSITASNEPLYVIDGVPIQNSQTEGGGLSVSNNSAESPSLPRSPLNLINPADIATITILKDAAATAIYGSRAANGVVLIETKKGAAGQSTVEYDGYIASSAPSEHVDVLSGSEYRSFIQQQVDLGNLDASRLAGLGPSNTDWEDAVTRTAMTQNHNFSFSGGTQTTQYRASLNYMNQEGVVLANGFERYQGRLNGQSRAFNDKLQLTLNLTGSQVKNQYLAMENQGGFQGGVFQNMLLFDPTRPVQAADEVTGAVRYYEIPGQNTLRNPVALAEQINDRANTTRILGNASAAYTLIPSVVASVNVGVDRSSGLRQTYFPNANPLGAGTKGRARQTNRSISTATIQTLLTANRDLTEDQTLEAVGGYEYSDTRISEFGSEAQNFLTDAFGFNNLGAGATLIVPYSLDEPRRLMSLFARVNYGLRDRYFLTGVIRRDGSSVFGENNKYAVFPAISASWRLSQEGFMSNRPLGISELRLRAGYGLQGNQAIVPFNSLTLLGTNADDRYEFGNTLVTGVTPSQNANPDLKWETTAQTNLAVDYGFAEDRFTGSVEYYVKNTKDLLLRVDVAQPAPVGNQIQNIGRIRNKGLEASFDARVYDQPGRSVTAGLVLAVERNEVVDLGGRQFIATGNVSGAGLSGQRSQRIIPGQPIGTFWGPTFTGVNAEGKQEFVNFDATTDANGNQVLTRNGVTTSPGSEDYGILGDANPDWTLGLRSQANWGAWDASFLVRAVQGGKVFNNTALILSPTGNVKIGQNMLQSSLSDGVGIDEPAIYSSRYIEDGSFLRLQNITLGYTVNLRGGTLQPSSARFYLSGDNLLLFTDYTGYDPEVYTDASVDGIITRGADYLSYPRARTFTAGIRLGF
jgi:TonB-dependent starch-binding outer membrane protein SusC